MNNQINFLLQQAINFFEQGNLAQAKLLLNNVLKLQPKNFHALHIMGVVFGIEGKHDEARNFLLKAVKINPCDSYINFNVAKALAELGNDLDSIKYHQAATKITPQSPEAWLNFGKSLFQLHRFDEALAHYEKAIQLKPEFAEAWFNKGNVLHDLNRFDEALTQYEKAIQLKPDFAEAWFNKGKTLHDLKLFDEALTHYEKAIELKPEFSDAWFGKGKTLHDLKLFDEALEHYEEAIQLKPDYFEAWSNKGAILNDLKYFNEALMHCEKAIQLKPDFAEAWFNKGNTLHDLNRFDEALTHYDKALNLKPNIDWTFGNLIHTKMKICSWSGLSESLNMISERVLVREKVTSPFPLLALVDDVMLHQKSSKIYIQSKYPSKSILGPILKRSNSQKIRVGYFSADFHNHATGYLVAELFELHDKSKFELIGFSFGPLKNDEMRHRLEKAFDQFIEVGGKSDVEIAKLCRGLNIDIAVDLKGFTKDARTGIFAHRPAPIQVNYLGYPGTMGADYMDYIIADKTIIPVESQSCYTEKVVYLPNSYQVNDRKRLISERKFTRQELGLPKNGFVFCCFNNNFKILPATFEGWMRILKAVEGSVLWLLQDNSWAAENLKLEAQRQGVDAERLVFAKRMPLPEHLARHRQADLFLDTLPYNAHTTTSDALWAGLPVLTLRGNSFASRVSASLINAIGLPELITTTQEEYEALAIKLAMNPEKLGEIKLKLANNRLVTPLFDTVLFTKNLEAAYIQMHERYQFDLMPEDLLIN